MFASLPLAVTKKTLLTMIIAFQLAQSHTNLRGSPELFIRLQVLGRFHTECVGQEMSSESSKEIERKTPKTQPMKIDS